MSVETLENDSKGAKGRFAGNNCRRGNKVVRRSGLRPADSISAESRAIRAEPCGRSLCKMGMDSIFTRAAAIPLVVWQRRGPGERDSARPPA